MKPIFIFMAVSKQKKESILKDLGEQFKKSPFVVFVNFHGLNNAVIIKLRSLARQSNAKYQVAKKTLIRKILESFSLSGDKPSLEGEIGVIFGPVEKTTEIAKNLVKFIKEHKELTVNGGIFENRFVGPKIVSEFAVIPSREELLAKLVYMINAPCQGLVVTLNGVMRKFVSVLSQIKK